MKKLLIPALLSAVLMGTTNYAVANDELGMTPQATYELVQQDNAEVLFIDVRDPVEIMFIGFTDEVDKNIPYLLVDRNDWQEEQNRFRLYQNPDFVAQVEAALKEKGLDKDATIITMCRSGSERGLPSAKFLQENGFKNARYVINGFQGDSQAEGEQKGFRTKNGWQNSNLPWQGKANAEKIYRSGE